MIANYTSLYSLFHHDIFYRDDLFGFDTDSLLSSANTAPEQGFKSIAEVILQIVQNAVKGLKDGEVSLTLTGGMDSRVILAALLKCGIKPTCMTFGNPKNRDVIFARNIASKLGLPYHNCVQAEPTKEWYYEWVIETIKRDNGNAHLHRAHRTAAIAEHVAEFHPKVLLTGHMGGEGIRGLTYNNYWTSPFFQQVMESKTPFEVAAQQVLDDYFIKITQVDLEQLKDGVHGLPWMRNDKQANKFYFLYDLVAKIHHAQDIRLYKSYVSVVEPVFLSNEYLRSLFRSPYNMLKKNDGIMWRLKSPLFYCRLLECLFPALLDFPFANGFTPNEYLKGLWYYVPVKIYRDFKYKRSYPPTFSYGRWYVDFVKEHASNISPEIWEIYDKKRYMKALEENNHREDEGYWHKFSNPIYFDLVEKYKSGKLIV